MTPRVKQALAGCATVFLAIAVAAAPAGRSAAADPCRRTLAIDPQVTAGESAGTLTFEVQSGGCPAPGTVQYTVTPGSAVPATDFTLPGGVLRWEAGDTGARSIVATIRDDRELEVALEDFTVQLTAPGAGIVVLHGTGQGRILDDEGPGLIAGVDDGVVVHRLGHGYMLRALGYLCPPAVPPPPGPLTLVWSTDDGTANAGVDYVAVTGRTQNIPAGATRVEFELTLLPRPAGTPSRWFTVRIVAVSSGTVVDALAVVTIDGS